MQHLQTAFISLLSTLILSPFAYAVDPGTYRPGQPYGAIAASSHNQCQAQCQGDAACRGWNFVRANPRQKDGICEFNSRAVSPIQSPISVSSNQSQVINPTGQSRIIKAGTRTTRIGAPQPVQKQPIIRKKAPIQTQSAKSVTPPKASSAQPQRRVIRRAVPTQAQPQASAYRHSLGAIPQRLKASTRPEYNPQAITRTSNGLPPRAPAQRQQARPQPQQALAPRPLADPRLQQRFNQAQRSPQQQSAQAPRRGGLLRALTGQDKPVPQNAQQRPALPPQAQAPRQAPLPQQVVTLSAEEAGQQSLYGHLNDDVKAPKALTAEDLALPNDQAIPTVQSVPVKPADREAFSGLAGG